MTLPGGDMKLFGKAATEPEEESQNLGSYEILYKPKHGNGKSETGQLTRPTTVSQMLDQSGAIKKYKAMDITIFRKVKGSPVPLKMEIAYSAKEKNVRPEQDYAIQPGDKILLEEKSNASIGKMLDGLTKF